MKYDKPFLTYEDQIKLLEKRKFSVSDEIAAQNILREFSYYTLVNGYKDIVHDAEEYRQDYILEDLVQLHLAAQNIQFLLLKYILMIESSLKTKVSYYVGENFGVWTDLNDENSTDSLDYLNTCHYSSSGGYTKVRNKKLRDFKRKLMNKRELDPLIA